MDTRTKLVETLMNADLCHAAEWFLDGMDRGGRRALADITGQLRYSNGEPIYTRVQLCAIRRAVELAAVL